jgi:hypothetical protein
MNEKPQFSLAYLFWETSWIAATLGLGRFMLTLNHPSVVLVSLVFCAVAGASFGGLYKRMDEGSLAGLVIWLIAAIFAVLYFVCRIYS